tara:strand:- start:8331 stop:9062 length:732 start_codon:yes stop_codon:yes gene_type:complete
MKRGQVTLFIILGIVIVLITGLVLYLTDSPILSFSESTEMKEERSHFESYVEECHEQALNDLVYATSKQMYAFDLGVDYLMPLGYPVFYAGTNRVPKEYEEEFETFVEEELGFCLTSYSPEGYTFEFNEVSVELELDEFIESVASIEASVSNEDSTIILDEDYPFVLEFDLKKIFDVADLYVNQYIENEGGLSTVSLAEWKSMYEVTFSIFPDIGFEVITIIDESYLIDYEPYEFVFVVEEYE